VAGSQLESEAERAERMAAGKRSASHAHGASHSVRKKSKRSSAAVGAAIIASAAVVATFVFVLTNRDPSSPRSDGPPIPAPQTSAPPQTKSAGAAPAAVNTVKADRKPGASKPTAPKPSVAKTTTTKTSATPNTGPATPVFRRGQWIAVLDTYPTDAGMDAEQLAKELAAKLIAAGVPGRAMFLNGQYPGIANSSLEPETDAWVVYLSALPSAEAALNLCQASKTQAVHSNIACPTYEPAAKPG
jgi:cytoskeletal protein RodZ